MSRWNDILNQSSVSNVSRENGILVVKNFLSLGEVDSLRAACSQLVQVVILEKYDIYKVNCKMTFSKVQVSNWKNFIPYMSLWEAKSGFTENVRYLNVAPINHDDFF